MRDVPPPPPADLEDVLTAIGVEVTDPEEGFDDEVFGRCPAHLRRVGKPDVHPSWSVNRRTAVHNCFSCGYSGTLLQLVIDQRGDNDAFAAAGWLRSFEGDLREVSWVLPAQEERPQRLSVAVQYATYVDPPPKALSARRIDLEAAQHYGVRWDPATKEWILPIWHPDGDLMGWQRKGPAGVRNHPLGVRKAQTLFGFNVFPVGEAAVLVESPLDVLRLYTAGYDGGLASFGATVSQEQMRRIKEVFGQLLVVAMDNDAAGRESSNVLKWDWGCRVAIMRFFAYPSGGGKDIGELSDAEIERGIQDAQNHLLAQFGPRPRSQHETHRRSTTTVQRPRTAVRRQRHG